MHCGQVTGHQKLGCADLPLHRFDQHQRNIKFIRLNHERKKIKKKVTVLYFWSFVKNMKKLKNHFTNNFQIFIDIIN